jgi:hypothetical protein
VQLCSAAVAFASCSVRLTSFLYNTAMRFGSGLTVGLFFLNLRYVRYSTQCMYTTALYIQVKSYNATGLYTVCASQY